MRLKHGCGSTSTTTLHSPILLLPELFHLWGRLLRLLWRRFSIFFLNFLVSPIQARLQAVSKVFVAVGVCASCYGKLARNGSCYLASLPTLCLMNQCVLKQYSVLGWTRASFQGTKQSFLGA